MKIAVSGKGGVGKTTIMALLAAHLATKLDDVLIIDADPSPHMAQTLGIQGMDGIIPIADMKDLLKERSGQVDGSPFYNINPKIDDLPERFMRSTGNIRLMVLGAIQAANKGCACAENTVLKRLLTKLLLSPSQAILIDMEAGVEHLGRGTLAGVDHLLIIVIPSNSGVRTALKIRQLAEDVGIKKISYVGNLVADSDDESFLRQELGEEPLACYPDSPIIKKAERRTKPLTEIAADFADISEQIITKLSPQ